MSFARVRELLCVFKTTADVIQADGPYPCKDLNIINFEMADVLTLLKLVSLFLRNGNYTYNIFYDRDKPPGIGGF